MPGTIGIAPSANLNPEKVYPSLFKPVHRSAPDIAGKGIANPIGQLGSSTLMLDFLTAYDAATAIVHAIDAALTDPSTPRTPDMLGGTASTQQLAQAIIDPITP